ncbi:RNA helicase/RNAse III, putative [Anopheles sinensis]|uniref:RNA helicase/RNAse III, putative n=1 Tax=Anopheles sinensis TaxID=74873 RepID=A0A084VJ05_ANOSI|nr:RNA helicase/RNAse III, putative [Anopheles sinensis]
MDAQGGPLGFGKANFGVLTRLGTVPRIVVKRPQATLARTRCGLAIAPTWGTPLTGSQQHSVVQRVVKSVLDDGFVALGGIVCVGGVPGELGIINTNQEYLQAPR